MSTAPLSPLVVPPGTTGRHSAVLLAASCSNARGQEKALLDAGGIPLWRRLRDLLASTGPAEIFLSARPAQAWTRKAEGFQALLHDATTGCGPISGITAAIERATQPHVLVLSIDFPHMNREWLLGLLAGSAPGVGVVGRRGTGLFEPLAALYPRDLMPLAWEALARGNYALDPLIASSVAQGLMRMRAIATHETAWFEGWTRQDFVQRRPGT